MTDKTQGLTARQEDCIAHIATTEKVTGKRARELYLERVHKRVKNGGTEANLQEEMLGKPSKAAPMPKVEAVEPAHETKKKVVGGTWTETKLGATVVLPPAFLRECGFNERLTTGEVGRMVKRLIQANKDAIKGGAV
jgi:hypothetical protein